MLCLGTTFSIPSSPEAEAIHKYCPTPSLSIFGNSKIIQITSLLHRKATCHALSHKAQNPSTSRLTHCTTTQKPLKRPQVPNMPGRRTGSFSLDPFSLCLVQTNARSNSNRKASTCSYTSTASDDKNNTTGKPGDNQGWRPVTKFETAAKQDDWIENWIG